MRFLHLGLLQLLLASVTAPPQPAAAQSIPTSTARPSLLACIGCAKSFEANGGCAAVNGGASGKEVQQYVAKGCGSCTYVAEQLCSALTEAPSAASTTINTNTTTSASEFFTSSLSTSSWTWTTSSPDPTTYTRGSSGNQGPWILRQGSDCGKGGIIK